MKLLAIDTSSDVTLLGLQVRGELLDGSLGPGRQHSRQLLPAIESLLAEAGLGLGELDGLVLGKGPGSFTGLRIGVGVAQGLAYGLGLPVALVSSLACRAQQLAAAEGSRVAVALKARLTEVYFGAYRMAAGLAEAHQDECVAEASQVPRAPSEPAASASQWLGLGDGWEFRERLEGALGVRMARVTLASPLSSGSLLALGSQALAEGRTVTALAALPEYLRETVAAKPAQRPCPDSS